MVVSKNEITAVSFSIRPYTSADYDAFVRIDEATQSTAFWGEADWRPIHPPQDETPDAKRYVAVYSTSGQIVGYGASLLSTQSNIDVMVHPDWQRKGVATLLWERIREDLWAANVETIGPWVRVDNRAACRWVESIGFTHVNQDGPVQLFVHSADDSRLVSATENLARRGIVLTTLANEKQTNPNCLAEFYDAFQDVGKDVPGYTEAIRATYAQCMEQLAAPGMSLESVFVAKYENRYVGLSIIGCRITPDDIRFAGTERPDCLSQHLTGVRRAYRRQGIARALKLHTIDYAKRHGYQRILSNSDNPAMRALNKELGFRTGPWRVYHLDLTA